jgi:hypothetical protein
LVVVVRSDGDILPIVVVELDRVDDWLSSRIRYPSPSSSRLLLWIRSRRWRKSKSMLPLGRDVVDINPSVAELVAVHESSW